jgi:hypothetical protein
VSAASGIAGGIMQSNAASKGQAQAQQQFLMQRNDLGPYREAGLAPLAAQQNLLGLNGQPAADAAMAQFQQSPGYQFQFDEGMRALEAGQAAQGMLRSGATLKREMEFGQGLANQDFTNYYNRLNALSTLGQNSAAGGATTAGQAASAALNGANAQSSIYGNTASALGGTANTLLNNQAVQKWLGGSGGSGAFNPAGGLSYQAGTSPGYGDQLFQSGGIF